MWNSVFRLYRRWIGTGVVAAKPETLPEMVERKRSADMNDSTVLRAHYCAAGGKDRLKSQRRLAERAAVPPPNFMRDATARFARSASC